PSHARWTSGVAIVERIYSSTGFGGESSRRSWAGNRLAAGPVQGGIRTRPDGVRDDEDTALEPGPGGDGRRGPAGGPAGPGLWGTGGAGRHRPAGPDHHPGRLARRGRALPDLVQLRRRGGPVWLARAPSPGPERRPPGRPPPAPRGASRPPPAVPDAGKAAEELLTAKVDALDITVLRGGGRAVGDWARGHGFWRSRSPPRG